MLVGAFAVTSYTTHLVFWFVWFFIICMIFEYYLIILQDRCICIADPGARSIDSSIVLDRLRGSDRNFPEFLSLTYGKKVFISGFSPISGSCEFAYCLEDQKST